MKTTLNYFKSNSRVFGLAFFLLLFLISCSQSNIVQDDDNYTESYASNMKTLGGIVLQKNVIILSDESVSAITSADDQKIIFGHNTAQMDSIKVGTVVVGTRIDGDKINNILAKVTSVSETGNRFILQTVSAKLEEFIYSGTIRGVYDPSEKAQLNVNGRMVNYIPVEGFVSQDLYNKINHIESRNLNKRELVTLDNFSFNRKFPFNQQIGPVTSDSDITVKGGFTPKIDYYVSFAWGHLSDFYVNFIMDDIKLDATANIYGKVGYTVSVTDYVSIPISPIVLGPTGLIIGPNISAGPYVAASASGKAHIELLNVEGSANFLIGKTPDLNAYFEKKNDYLDFTNLGGDVQAEIGIEAKGAIGLQFTAISLANIGLRGRVSTLPSLELKLIPEKYGTFDIKAKIQADMFCKIGVTPFSFEKDFPLFQKEYQVYSRNF